MQPDELDQLVATTFAELSGGEVQFLTRTILLRNRYFVGYQFCCGDLRAVWFADSGIVKFHDGHRKLVRKIDQAEPMKKAA